MRSNSAATLSVPPAFRKHATNAALRVIREECRVVSGPFAIGVQVFLATHLNSRPNSACRAIHAPEMPEHRARLRLLLGRHGVGDATSAGTQLQPPATDAQICKSVDIFQTRDFGKIMLRCLVTS